MWASRFTCAARTSFQCSRRAAAVTPLARAPVRGSSLLGRRWLASTPATLQKSEDRPSKIEIDGSSYSTDSWYNTPSSIIDKVPRRLHLQSDHPVSITRQIIESVFPAPTYKHHNNLRPVVSTLQNFDSLGVLPDHPGRSKNDTYYINETTLLRTHSSAHQADTFRANLSEGYTISADVYRRDEVDRSHYPVFHQMEGARSWDRASCPDGDVAAAVRSDLEKLPKHDMKVEDPNPPFHPERNPIQDGRYSDAETEAIGAHLKRSLELAVVEIFSRAKAAALRADPNFVDQPLQVRWIEAYFPFTSPSWELEVYYNGDWLEILGCGVVQHDLYANAGIPTQRGWAFGLGLERIAMVLFQIPDIRLFWSQDERFLQQFRGVSANLDTLSLFNPFSKFPPCPKDLSFWLPPPPTSSSSAAAAEFHESDFLDIVRGEVGDVVEDVKLIDDFTHPKTGRTSKCYRITYRSLERTLTNAETNDMHDRVTKAAVEKLGVVAR